VCQHSSNRTRGSVKQSNDEDLPDTAEIPVLGLSNKALGDEAPVEEDLSSNWAIGLGSLNTRRSFSSAPDTNCEGPSVSTQEKLLRVFNEPKPIAQLLERLTGFKQSNDEDLPDNPQVPYSRDPAPGFQQCLEGPHHSIV
jgi:hypothetical protein